MRLSLYVLGGRWRGEPYTRCIVCLAFRENTVFVSRVCFPSLPRCRGLRNRTEFKLGDCSMHNGDGTCFHPNPEIELGDMIKVSG